MCLSPGPNSSPDPERAGAAAGVRRVRDGHGARDDARAGTATAAVVRAGARGGRAGRAAALAAAGTLDAACAFSERGIGSRAISRKLHRTARPRLRRVRDGAVRRRTGMEPFLLDCGVPLRCGDRHRHCRMRACIDHGIRLWRRRGSSATHGGCSANGARDVSWSGRSVQADIPRPASHIFSAFASARCSRAYAVAGAVRQYASSCIGFTAPLETRPSTINPGS